MHYLYVFIAHVCMPLCNDISDVSFLSTPYLLGDLIEGCYIKTCAIYTHCLPMAPITLISASTPFVKCLWGVVQVLTYFRIA